MTLEQWASQQTGVTVKIPAGTILDHDWWYLEEGEWTRKPKKWNAIMPKEYRPRKTEKDTYIEIEVDAGFLLRQAKKAMGNRSGRSQDGPLTLKRRK